MEFMNARTPSNPFLEVPSVPSGEGTSPVDATAQETLEIPEAVKKGVDEVCQAAFCHGKPTGIKQYLAPEERVEVSDRGTIIWIRGEVDTRSELPYHLGDYQGATVIITSDYVMIYHPSLNREAARVLVVRTSDYYGGIRSSVSFDEQNSIEASQFETFSMDSGYVESLSDGGVSLNLGRTSMRFSQLELSTAHVVEIANYRDGTPVYCMVFQEQKEGSEPVVRRVILSKSQYNGMVRILGETWSGSDVIHYDDYNLNKRVAAEHLQG